MPRIYLFLFTLLLMCAAPEQAAASAKGKTGADVWQATLSDYDNAPTFLIAVDKQSQQLFAFERHSPMRLIAEFPVTTGQAPGDKIKTGDLKTPEGIYFVVRHITSGLNYTLYGNEAYPLNYPNPVDKLRKKTGYGIWIHGKGVPLTPRDTQGCVGMNNQDIATLGRKIYIGQPVTLAANILHKPEPTPSRAATVDKLERNVLDWAKAWSDRSHRMFDFYDGEAYGISQGQPFKAFRAQKERLFKTLDWIDTKVSDIQILEGPGYWVTWFNQDYRASNLSTSGTRRLYWQPDASGELRIVGMEWIPGLKSPVLVASADKAATTVPPAVNPVLADSGPAQGKSASEAMADASSSAKAAAEPAVKAAGRTSAVAEAGAKSAAAPGAEAKADLIVAQVKTETVYQTGRTSLDSAKPAGQPETKTDKTARTATVAQAGQAGQPAQASQPKTDAASAASATQPRPESAKAAQESGKPTQTKAEQDGPEQLKAEAGKGAGPENITVASIKQPAAVSAQPAKTPPQPSAQDASALIEKWRRSWEKGDLDSYLTFYSPKAVQAGRDFERMKAQKRKIWKNARPAKVAFHDIRITRTARGFNVTMLQSYTDSKGYSDRGMKTLQLEADGKTMRIVREDWTPEI